MREWRMSDLARFGRFRMAHDWPLIAVALALLAAIGIAEADTLYRHDGTVVYPAMMLVNYTLRGVGPQIPWLAVAAAAFLFIWIGLRRQRRVWLAAGLLLAIIAGAGLIGGRSPLLPLASASSGGQIYRVSRIDEAGMPELYLLFRCGRTGIICQQVRAFASFDVATGGHVSGPLTLAVDPATHAVTVRIAGHAIGTYHPA